jgi:chromosome segregation ATPase
MAQGDFIDTDLLEEEPKSLSSTVESRATNLKAKFTSKEEEARKKLEEIRHQMEDLERQRLENAELTRRLEEFDQNKAETVHQLNRIIGSLEKHELEISRQLSTVSSVRKSLQSHLSGLEQVHEESWTGDNVRQNLQDAVETLEEARSELTHGRQQLTFLENVDIDVGSDETTERQTDRLDFKQEFVRGLAWTLPLIAAAVILTILVILKS